jgi:hypothetical protein
MFLYGAMGHYDCITICIFGEMITRLISDSSHYTLSYLKSLSLMKTVINSKMNLWINLWITLCVSAIFQGYGRKFQSRIGVLAC